jgi:hypothetical protein
LHTLLSSVDGLFDIQRCNIEPIHNHNHHMPSILPLRTYSEVGFLHTLGLILKNHFFRALLRGSPTVK